MREQLTQKGYVVSASISNFVQRRMFEMKHTIAMKLFLITVLVALLVTACGGVQPIESTPDPTQTPTSTLVALPAIERYATATSTPPPTVTPTSIPGLVSDSTVLAQNEGEVVRVIGYTIVDETHMDVYMRSVSEKTNITLHLYEEGLAVILSMVGEDGFTHARESWNRLPDDVVSLSVALDSFIRQRTEFTYEIYWFSQQDEYAYVYLYEQYDMTVRDESLYAYANAHTGPEGCVSYPHYYVPLDMVDCLVDTYHEWGTKRGLAEFAEVTDLPLDAVGWYEREGYAPYIEGVEEEDVAAYLSEHNMPIEVKMFADWNYLGNTAYFLYKADSVPDMFVGQIADFPEYTMLTDEDRFYIYPDAILDGGRLSGTLITYTDGYDDELFVPDGYVIVFVTDIVDEGCECWSPIFDFTVLGVYR